MSDDIEVWKQRNEILHKKVERLMEELRQEHKLRQEAEGELTIVKTNSVHLSPEMRDANKRIKELENSLSIALDITEQQQRDLKIKDEEIGRLYNKIQR